MIFCGRLFCCSSRTSVKAVLFFVPKNYGRICWCKLCSTGGGHEHLEEALGHHNWKGAMDEEISTLQTSSTWHLMAKLVDITLVY
jgi:hypothetical protein